MEKNREQFTDNAKQDQNNFFDRLNKSEQEKSNTAPEPKNENEIFNINLFTLEGIKKEIEKESPDIFINIEQDQRHVKSPDNIKKYNGYFVIVDCIDFRVYKGSENLYFDLTIYKAGNDETPYILKFWSKDSHEILRDIIKTYLNTIKQTY